MGRLRDWLMSLRGYEVRHYYHYSESGEVDSEQVEKVWKKFHETFEEFDKVFISPKPKPIPRSTKKEGK